MKAGERAGWCEALVRWGARGQCKEKMHGSGGWATARARSLRGGALPTGRPGGQGRRGVCAFWPVSSGGEKSDQVASTF